MKKILILGSGALKIGEAGEFDYSGSQAIKAFKEEGIKTVLVNPNIATVQTSDFLADEVYFLPVTPYFVEKVIKKEKPDAITISFGGQTALNCGMELYKKGVLKKNHVRILGTPIESVITSEDRQLFADHLKKINIPTPISHAATSYTEALHIAKKIKFPVMVRVGYALGGQKSGVAGNEGELEKIVNDALSFSSQILVEKYLHHFKEIEYEIVRDGEDNCVAICNMENMDPLGIHTGESIVVAPSQTLTNYEYHSLRKVAIDIVRSFNIVGECNVQFALNPRPDIESIEKARYRFSRPPHPKGTQAIVSKKISSFSHNSCDFYVIELNARLSRSSALASKATGYPLAYVAAKLALGKNLMQIKNQVTQVTQSFFEPALDYLVVKVPRWDLEKFTAVEERIGSSMKSVGEVMAIGRSFEEAIQKAIRMLDIGVQGITDTHLMNGDDVQKYIEIPTPRRIFALVEGIRKGLSIEKIYEITGIDPWYLYRIKEIVAAEVSLIKNNDSRAQFLSQRTSPSKKRDSRSVKIATASSDQRSSLKRNKLLYLKQLGFSDKKIGELIGDRDQGLGVRKLRKKWGIAPCVFQIDTLAGEVPAKTNYLYTTYHASHHDVKPLGKKSVIVLGSGTYRIGSSVEFDWSSVNAILSLKKHGKKSIVINCNPETVSTDYDISDRLYFEELSFERVTDIYEYENPKGIIVSVGGQTPNNLVQMLDKAHVSILGTNPEDIDRAEDRSKFSKLLDDLKIPQPWWSKFTDMQDAIKFTDKIGFPILIRPSYVLSGQAMSVCYNKEELVRYIDKATLVSKQYPITISKFFTEAKEIELDAVAQKGKIKVYAISEHLEHAGVHSGDASIVYPPQKMYILTEKKVIDIAEKLAQSLHISGPFNIQYLARENDVYVIEINVRASRTLPFISKVTHVNFIKVFTDSLFKPVRKIDLEYPDYALVKVPQFSFARLEGADPILRVEMSSTGEVACLGDTFEEAFLKAIYATGIEIKNKAALLSIGGIVNKKKFLGAAQLLKAMGFTVYATKKTCGFLNENGVDAEFVYKEYEKKEPTVTCLISSKKVSLVINISEVEEGEGRSFTKQLSDGYKIRRAAIDNNIALFTDLNKAKFFILALYHYRMEDLKIKSWREYASN